MRCPYHPIIVFSAFSFFAFFSSFAVLASTPLPSTTAQIGIDEQLGETVPLDLSFKDEFGSSVSLRELVTKPTILTLVYYECPGICSPLLGSLAHLIDQVDAGAGVDYNVLTLSFDETNTPELAHTKKANYFKTLKQPIPETSWRFLTGDAASIKQLTDAVGFGFKREGKEFIHTAALIVLSPQGKIVRYLYGSNYASAKPEAGLRFLPFDVKMALVEAAAGRVGYTVGQVLRYCFSYDPEGRRYVLNITQIAGTVITALGIGFFIYLVTRKKRGPS